MASFQAYEFICTKCDKPLFSSLENRWLRVSKNHLTFHPRHQIEALGGLHLSEDALSGSKELADCEIVQLYCGACWARVGVKCVNATDEKGGFIDRFFLREIALGVNGLTAQWNQNSAPSSVPAWRATPGIALVIESDPTPLPVALRIVPVEHAADRPLTSNAPKADVAADVQLQDQIAQNNELKELLGANIRMFGEFVQSIDSLKAEISSFSRELNKQRKRRSKMASKTEARPNASRDHEITNHTTEELSQAGPSSTAMNVDAPVTETNMEPPHPPTQDLRRIRTPSTLSTQQYLEQNVVSDDPQDSDFELSDASRADKQRQRLSTAMADPGGAHQVLMHSTSQSTNLNSHYSNPNVGPPQKPAPDGVHESASHHGAARVALRGRRARRGVSGRRFSSDWHQPATKALPTHLSRDRKPPRLNTNRPQPRRARSSGYRSSPLATSFQADDMEEDDDNSPASNSSASASIAASSVGRMSHRHIMKMVNKGMNSDFAKSHLLRGPTRLPSQGFSAPSRVALASS